MRQKEIIAKLKQGAGIAVYHRGRNRFVYLNCNRYAKFPDRERQYRITYAQFQSLYRKGIIEEQPERCRSYKDDISSFYEYAGDHGSGGAENE